MKKKIIFMIILIFASAYILYQVYVSNFTKVKTQPVTYTSLSDSIQSESFIVRDEVFINNNSNGVMSYLLEDGEKVAKDGTVAEIFNNYDDAKTQKEIKNIDNEINNFKQLSYLSNSYTSDPLATDEQIGSSIQKMIKDINASSYNNIQKSRSDILYLMNEKQIITGKVASFNNKIDELQSQRDTLSKSHGSSIGKVLAPDSGYFVSKLDGFENLVNFDNVLSLSVDNIKSILSSEKKLDSNKNIIGKVIRGINWYIVCNVSSDEAFKLYNGKSVNITLPLVSTEKFPATVAAINQQDKKSEAAVILSLNNMDNRLALTRNETVKIDIDTYNGLLINKNSLHEDILRKTVVDENGNESLEEKKVQGVYILRGKEIVFKQVVPIYSDNNYIVCEQNPSSDKLFNGETITILDEVVTEGTNLYNGKIIK